jgi:hypothetical protein
VDRREFLKIGVGAASGVALRGRATSGASVILVTENGADQTGQQDATAAVTKAIAALPRVGGTLVFPHGTYSFSRVQGDVLQFEGFRGLTIEGNGSLLQFAGFARPFQFNGCSDLELRNLRLDFPHPPFSQGVVTATSTDHFDIQIDAQFIVDGNERIQAIGEYDRARRLPAPNGVDAYGGVSAVQLIAPATLRVFLTRNIGVKTGMTLVLRYQVYGSDAITLRSCTGCRLVHITIYTTPGLGVLGLGSADISLEDYNVTTSPGSNRLLSTTADASHFTDCRGSLNINGCSFFGMGDDAVNAFASYWKVVRALSPTSLEVAARGGSPIGTWQLPHSQDHLRFVDGKTFAPLYESTLIQATESRPNAILAFARPAASPIPPGSLVVNLDGAPQLTVKNCRFLGNRARGVVAHSNVLIEENTFAGCSLFAILLAPDARWMEGPVVTNVSILTNTFADCGYGRPDDRRGAICIDTAHDPRPLVLGPPQVNADIRIENNVFGPMSIARIFCSVTTRVSILRNTINEAPAPPTAGPPGDAIVLASVSRAVLSDNIGHGEGILLEGCPDPPKFTHNQGLAVRTK